MTTITQERSGLSSVAGAPKLRRRESWGSRFNYGGSRAVSEPATRAFIHISVTNSGNYSSNDAHARAIESIGISRFPSTGISYNRGCMPDGTLYEFQPIGRRGAHTVNDFRRGTCSTSGCPGRGSSITAPSWNLNYNARAYVICQNTGNSVSDKQVDNLARAVVADYRAGFITLDAVKNIHGHRCVSAKSCPGDKMWARMGDLQSKVNYYLSNGLDEDDMFTDEDRKLLERLNQVLCSNSDAKIQRSDGSNSGTSGMRYAVQRIWKVLENPLGSEEGLTPRQAISLSAHRTAALISLVEAQRPLLEAAAEGRALTDAEVQVIASACAAAVPEDIAGDLLDELVERLDEES